MKSKIHEYPKNKFYRLSRKLLLLPIVLFTIISCETGEVGKTASTHIYAVGFYTTNDGGVEGYISKDGVSSSLGTEYFVADVFVQGNDIYTSGNRNNEGVYTKNGVFTSMGAGSSVNNIYVDGNDIYLSGKMGDSPAYWKNGVITLLDISAGFKGVAYDITVSNHDVYVGGYQHNWDLSNPITNILYWKNGVRTTVNSTHVYSFNWIGEISIAVDNNDVYLAVNERDNNIAFNGNAYLIKNGTQETLIQNDAEVHDIVISDSDIYLCGATIPSAGSGNKSLVWKNGAILVEKDMERGAFSSLAVVDNNIFAVGIDIDASAAQNHATTLINNVFEVVPDFGTPGYSSGYVSVFVTE